jgi:hypothetical protein
MFTFLKTIKEVTNCGKKGSIIRGIIEDDGTKIADKDKEN